MQWIYHYQLFLFDFDGILVNTEELHYKSYLKMCQERGFSLKWDLPTYVRYAMYSAEGLKEGIYCEFPDLYRIEPSWDVLYQEKKRAYYTLLQEEGTTLMPGVETLLKALDEANINRCVVTHSSEEQVELIRKQHPILNSIPTWFTREHYQNPKPSSECYLKAIATLKKGDKPIIGFEDSPRGLQALLGTEAEGNLITPYFAKGEIDKLRLNLQKEFTCYPSFVELNAEKVAG